MRIRAAALLLIASMLPASPALAANQSLPVESGKPWLHASSGLRIPDELVGFKRGRSSDFGTSQSDVSFMFANDTTRSVATVFIYRAGNPNVSIWADRADSAIRIAAPENYGKLDTAGRMWTRFSPWPNSPDSGLRIIYPASGKEASATGLAMAQYGDWLVKVRITSFRQSAAQLDDQLEEFFAALALPAPKRASGPAYAIQPCANALPDKKAKLVPAGNGDNMMAGALTNSIMGEADEADAKASTAKPAIFCRDASSKDVYGVYRADGTRDAYLIAAGDGGVTLTVGPDTGMRLLDPKSSAYAVTVFTTDRQVGFAPYQSMPSPGQVMENLGNSRPTYVRSRIPGKEKEIQIIM